jgi:thiol-disulfide isomerase/thioredoxin/tetratricopeptide (TPR) repeat protein
MNRIIACLCGVVATGVVLAVPAASRAAAQVGDPIQIQFKAVDGSRVSTDALHGKLIVFDFWATWCGPCMQMVPHMVELNEKYASKGLQIVGVSLDEDRAAMLRTIKQKGMAWPEYFDGAGWENKIWKQYGSNGIPFTILVGPDGKALYAGHPAAGLDGAIERAFKETPPQLVDPKVVAEANNSLMRVESSIKSGDTKSAIKQMAKVPPIARLDPAFAKHQEQVQKKLQSAADALLSEVQGQIGLGQYIDSVARLRELSDALAGLPQAARAKLMLSGLMSKPEVRAALSDAEKQLKAGDALDVAQKLQAQKKDELAYARYAEVVKFFPGTEAAGKAQAQLDKYRQDAAFMTRMIEHAATGKATAALHLGDSYKAAGDLEMARKKYQGVIADYPGTSYAQRAQKALADLSNQ